MRWLVDGAHADDSLFIHCELTEASKHGCFDMTFALDSGHGGRTRDLDGDEPDGWDEGGAILL